MAVENEMMAANQFGDADSTDATRGRIIDSIKSLVQDDFFVQVRPAQFQIRSDLRQDADDHVVKHPPSTADSKLKGKKAQEQQYEFVNAELEQRLDSYLPPQVVKAQLDGISAQQNGTDMPDVDDLHISINFAKAVKGLRNRVLVDYVRRTLGEHCAKVAAATFSHVDLTTPSLSHTGPAPGLQNQLLSLTQVVHTHKTLDKNYADERLPHTNGWHHDEEMINGIAETNGDDDVEEVCRDLESMAEGPCNFLQGNEETGFSVDRIKLRQFLIRQEITKIARQRVGPIGVRLMRMLMDKGRMDEKLLQERGLLMARGMRECLSQLHTQGFIELQEVPKDPQRQPNRTMFLWFYDEERARKLLLEGVYKTMTRLYQRLQHEREQMRVTLEKIEKEDCEGREVEVLRLDKPEMVALGQLRRKERWLMGEIMRLDDTVALLRDL